MLSIRSLSMLAGRPGLSPLMVGRSAPLAGLQALVRDASHAGRSSLALVSGEAGVGKTRLLRELVTAVPPAVVVLAGQAEPGALGRPWELAGSVLGVDLAAAPADHRTVAEQILARFADRPGLVIFEDLHWADAESVGVFERLAVAAPPKLVLVGSYRPEELSRRLPGGELLLRLERRQQVVQLRLERLSRGEVGAFLTAVYGRQLPGAVVAALHARTGGNPFFLEEILTAAGDVAPEELASQPLPWSLAELVQRQLDGLGAEERRVVEAAAVLGRRARFELLVAMLGCTEDALIAHLRGLVDRGVIVEEAEDEFVFRHALVRDAVEGQLLGRERRRLHEAALLALRGTDCDLSDCARHAAGAGRYDEMVALAREAVGGYLDRGSTYQALGLATEALAEAPEDPALLAAAARSTWMLGLHEEGLGYARRWYDLTTDGDPAEHSAAVRVLGRFCYELERRDELHQLVDEARHLVQVLPAGEERARAMAWVAQVEMLELHTDEAFAWADRAIEEADAVGAKSVRAQALVERASALRGVGSDEEALAELAIAVDEAEAAGDWVLASRGINNMLAFLPNGSPRAWEVLGRLREAAERAGFDALSEQWVTLHTASWAVGAGDRAMALAQVKQARDMGLAHDPNVGAWLAGVEATLALEAGQFREAADRLAGVPARGSDASYWRLGERLRAAAAVGDLEAIAPLVDDFDRACNGTVEGELVGMVIDCIDGLVRAGMPTAEVERAIGPAIERGRSLRSGAVIDGVLATHHGDHERAVPLLRAGMDPSARIGNAFHRALLHTLVARSLLALGRRDNALEEARAGRALLEHWPGWRRDELDALVRRLEGSAGEPEGELTAREREVAALLAEGLSNAELARRLFISPKTAAVHVSNILMKLGMSSRTEVAAWAVRTGLAASAGEATEPSAGQAR